MASKIQAFMCSIKPKADFASANFESGVAVSRTEDQSVLDGQRCKVSVRDQVRLYS
jgi:hypothetical protein